MPKAFPCVAAAIALMLALPIAAPPAHAQALALKPCRLVGLEHEAQCGVLSRPLDPADAAGRRIDIHVAVLPALARNKVADPVFLLAGGPGQSAIELAPTAQRLLARLGQRRDIVLVDQRGTGRSAPLACEELPATAPIADAADPARQRARLTRCLSALQALPHGDLRHFTTWIATRDLDAVRASLGAARINLVGASYGTRAALDYLRQFPQHVRRVVIDGVAPPDMVLPAAIALDGQAALEQMFLACEADASGCARRHPQLRADWQRLLARTPLEVETAHPVSGRRERWTLSREGLLNLVRAPLYVPALAAGLPAALAMATAGRYEGLLGLASALGARRSLRLYEGMHFSVICSEDLGRTSRAAGPVVAPPADFGRVYLDQYAQVCAEWPRGAVPPAFYELPRAAAPTLLLSGGADPATPARHGVRVAAALGPQARHVVVAEAAHGVLGLACMRDLLYRFVAADDDAAALALPADCAARVPRPPAAVALHEPATEAAR